MLKEKMQKAKYAVAAAAPVCMSSVFALTSYAGDSGSSNEVSTIIQESLITAVGEVTTTLANVIVAVIPIALPLIGASMVVTIGLKIFKNITKQM